MKIDLFNIDQFIKVNHCQEVTNPVFFDFSGQPTADGLFSYDIFGYTDDERKQIFGYIDLGGHYVHPLVYQMLQSRMGAIGKIITGEKYAVIADKKIKLVPEGTKDAETGIDFIYDHFEQINWFNEVDDEEIESVDKKTRLKFLQALKKNEFFVEKWLVLPPFYREESSTNKSMGDNINKLYSDLLSKVRSMNLGFSFSFFNAEARLRVQNILKDIYFAATSPLSGKNLIMEKGKSDGKLVGSGKNSMIRRSLLGKGIDWTASSVISAPNNSASKSLADKPVPFGYARLPLATMCGLFQPFYISAITDLMSDILRAFVNEHTSIIKNIDMNQFGSEFAEKCVKSFINNIGQRNKPITITYTNLGGKKEEYLIPVYYFKDVNDAFDMKVANQRYLVLTDIIYLASFSVSNTKHVYVVRYPVADSHNVYPNKILLSSTTKLDYIVVSLYQNTGRDNYFMTDFTSIGYPKIPMNGATGNTDYDFIDVTYIGNGVLSGMGGDYDGDMVYMKGVFSEEANNEAERIIWSKQNFLNVKGTLTRSIGGIGKDIILGLYELTKEVD